MKGNGKGSRRKDPKKLRVSYRCTIGGCPLPRENTEDWGLVWNEKTGVCVECLHKVRLEIGFYKKKKGKKNENDTGNNKDH
jgi:hypothetical protein